MLKQLDLIVLALALPVFVVAGWPMLGYAVAAAAWLVQRAIELWSHRHAVTALSRSDRRAALGGLAGGMLVRLWVLTLGILLVGTLGEREDGLAAGVLCAVLLTAYFSSRLVEQLFSEEPT